MIEKYLPVMGVLIGVILGFILNEISKWIRDRRTIKKQRQSVKTLLILEVDHNLAMLQKYWTDISDIGNIQSDSEQARITKGTKLIKLPMPRWSHKMWESQFPLLSQSLTNEEIMSIHDFHSKLDLLDEIKFNLLRIESKTNEDARLENRTLASLSIWSFKYGAIELEKKFENIVIDLFSKGNPVKNGEANEKKE